MDTDPNESCRCMSTNPLHIQRHSSLIITVL